jgi:hypothetical protein
MATKKRKYCVHVYERPHEYENVEAKSPQEAEEKVIATEWAGDYERISQVEVMLQCEDCGLDNDQKNKRCEECGAKL